MFGYVMIDKGEMKFREFDIYQSYYCGLCKELKRKYGRIGQCTLTYDMTFLVILLSGLYEPRIRREKCRCLLHPVKKKVIRYSEITSYGADMNLLLTYYQCLDDWQDEKKYKKWILAKLLKGKMKKEQKLYREKGEKILAYLKELNSLERKGERDIDKVSGCFGRILEEVLAYRKDEWNSFLRRMGFYLGKYIYLLDAYEDLEKDKKDRQYNPLLYMEQEMPRDEFDKTVKNILNMMLGECCRAFEQLPIIENVTILRNILYSGVWTRYDRMHQGNGEKHDGSVQDIGGI